MRIPNIGPGIAINDRLKELQNNVRSNKKILQKFIKKYLAVNKINFEIKKNETIGLLGPNGCGKTTSIGMMLGLITPTEGEIIIDNKNLNAFKR